MPQKTELGQVWTPRWLAERILDEVGYTVDNPNILTATIMEPSFGTGAFLYPILDRLLEAAANAGLDPYTTADMVGDNVWGIEYDQGIYDQTRHELDAYLAMRGIRDVPWNLHQQDALVFNKANHFDYVVGNPPYIRIHDMDDELRESVRRFEHSTGTTDLYIIFFEIGMDMLRRGGVLGYITPNSFMRNTSQRQFRAELVNRWLLDAIIDFGARVVFPEVATYAAISILSRKKTQPETFIYMFEDDTNTYTVPVDYTTVLTNPENPLVFPDEANSRFVKQVADRPRALSDLLAVQYGVATLRDKIYTSPPADAEADVIRPVVKASTYKGTPVENRILFPYHLVEGRPMIIPEAEMAAAYPHAYAFFQANTDELHARDRDNGSLWYAYGRSQGLTAVQQPKLVFSHVVAADQTRIPVYQLPAETIVYGGMFVTALLDGPDLDELTAVLNSEDFCRFVKIYGKDMSGGYKSFTPKMLKNYRVA